MVGKTKSATKDQKGRMATIKELPCLPCILGLHGAPAFYKPMRSTVQHVVEGMKRLGHDFTYGSCAWHHLGECLPGWDRQQMGGQFGPSLAWGKRTFQGFFGTERRLVSLQDELIKCYEESPWPGYTVPRGVELKLVELWIGGG